MSARPPDVTTMLTELVKWLDLADKATTALARQQGHELNLGRGVQGDLLVLAAWLREHPDVDAQMYDVLDAIDAS